MTDNTTPPDWALIEAAKRSGWAYGTVELYYDNPVYAALCDMIAKYEQPPVDRKVLCAAEAWLQWLNIGDELNLDWIGIRAIELWIEGYGE